MLPEDTTVIITKLLLLSGDIYGDIHQDIVKVAHVNRVCQATEEDVYLVVL